LRVWDFGVTGDGLQGMEGWGWDKTYVPQ